MNNKINKQLMFNQMQLKNFKKYQKKKKRHF